MQGIDLKKTGQRIKEICKSQNISVKDIQETLFIGSFQSVYAWFSGKSLPSLDNLYRLSRLLKVPMDTLIVGQQIDFGDINLFRSPTLCKPIHLQHKSVRMKATKRLRSYYTKLTEKAF